MGPRGPPAPCWGLGAPQRDSTQNQHSRSTTHRRVALQALRESLEEGEVAIASALYQTTSGGKRTTAGAALREGCAMCSQGCEDCWHGAATTQRSALETCRSCGHCNVPTWSAPHDSLLPARPIPRTRPSPAIVLHVASSLRRYLPGRPHHVVLPLAGTGEGGVKRLGDAPADAAECPPWRPRLALQPKLPSPPIRPLRRRRKGVADAAAERLRQAGWQAPPPAPPSMLLPAAASAMEEFQREAPQQCCRAGASRPPAAEQATSDMLFADVQAAARAWRGGTEAEASTRWWMAVAPGLLPSLQPWAAQRVADARGEEIAASEGEAEGCMAPSLAARDAVTPTPLLGSTHCLQEIRWAQRMLAGVTGGESPQREEAQSPPPDPPKPVPVKRSSGYGAKGTKVAPADPPKPAPAQRSANRGRKGAEAAPPRRSGRRRRFTAVADAAVWSDDSSGSGDSGETSGSDFEPYASEEDHERSEEAPQEEEARSGPVEAKDSASAATEDVKPSVTSAAAATTTTSAAAGVAGAATASNAAAAAIAGRSAAPALTTMGGTAAPGSCGTHWHAVAAIADSANVDVQDALRALRRAAVADPDHAPTVTLEATHRLLRAGRLGQALAALDEGRRSWGRELNRADGLRALCHFLQWAESSDADLRRLAPDAASYGSALGEVWRGRSPLRHVLAARFQLQEAAADAGNGVRLALQLAALTRGAAGDTKPAQRRPPAVWRPTEEDAEAVVTESSEWSGSGDESGADAGPDAAAAAAGSDRGHPGSSFPQRAMPLDSTARKAITSCTQAMACDPGTLTPLLLLLTVAACSRSAVARTHIEARRTLRRVACDGGESAPAALDLFLALTLRDCGDRRAGAAAHRSALLVAATALATRAPHSADAACTALAAGLLELDVVHPCLPDAMRCACALQRPGQSAVVPAACGRTLWALSLALVRGSPPQVARNAALATLPPPLRQEAAAKEEELRTAGRPAQPAPRAARLAAVQVSRKRKRPRLEWEASDSEEGDDEEEEEVQKEEEGAAAKAEQAQAEAAAPLLFSTARGGGRRTTAADLDAAAARLHDEQAPAAERLRGWLAALARDLAPFTST